MTTTVARTFDPHVFLVYFFLTEASFIFFLGRLTASVMINWSGGERLFNDARAPRFAPLAARRFFA